mmetsp:Transcript_39408/g.117990  ORF Transcript_39408/g.117990 Transcript_39408/m.117990 type:complete len:266 (+) Transcript_39408:50-847(+)
MAPCMFLLSVAVLAGAAAGDARAGASSALARLLASAALAPDDAAQALQELDTNQDGHVELSEVSAFATAKGLDYAATVKEFASYDADHDGRLNVAELAGVLGLPAPSVEKASVQEAPAPAQLRSRISRAANLLSSAPAAANVVGAAINGASGRQSSSVVSKLASQLALEASKTQEAQDLELLAAQARVQAEALQRKLVVKIREASAAAANAKAEELAQNLGTLEDEALRTEVRAAAMRTKMASDMKQVNDLSSIVKEGLAAVHRP